jgi:hypothetical protein
VKYEALRFADFSKLTTAVGDWTAMITKLEQLSDDARTQLSDRAKSANWQGVNATVSKEFIGKTALEFADAVKQATSIRNILRDTQDELTEYRRLLNEAISRGLKKNLTVIGNADGTFTVTMNRHPDRGADGTDIPEPAPHTPQDVTALRDEVKGILDKATSSDDSAAKALRGLAELSKYGFSDAPVIQDRDQAGTALHNWRIRQQGIEEEREYLKRTPHPPTGDGGKTEYGNANPAEKEMVLKHPLDGATYLSISAWAMRTAREEYEKDPSIDENAFRHTIWQARLSYEMGPEKAREWADAHEAYHPTSEQPDHMADLVNNVHGRDVGKRLADEIPYRPPSEYDPGSMIDVYPRIMDEARRYAKSGEAATSAQFQGF